MPMRLYFLLVKNINTVEQIYHNIITSMILLHYLIKSDSKRLF